MMEIHNTTEDIVFSMVQTIFKTIKAEGNQNGYCLCDQCQLDTICYVLNRSEPRYIVSNRGVARIDHDFFKQQQNEADIATLIHDGIRRVNHNQRPTAPHDGSAIPGIAAGQPAYSLPTIVGKIFDGATFSPLTEIKIELLRNGQLVVMKDSNWQNPYTLVANTAGAFTFWPSPIPAETANEQKIFEFQVKVQSPEYDTLTHFFKIPVVSKVISVDAYSRDHTFKLPDLYMFPPGEAEKNGFQD
jgi:competence protein ComFB